MSATLPLAGERSPAIQHRVDQAMIDAWSALSGDVNPLHIDPDYAANTRFGGTIAHGHLSLTWLCELLLAWRGPAWLSGGELTHVRFVGPVRPGDTVTVQGEVVEVSSEDGRVTCDLRVTVEEGEQPCVVGKTSFFATEEEP